MEKSLQGRHIFLLLAAMLLLIGGAVVFIFGVGYYVLHQLAAAGGTPEIDKYPTFSLAMELINMSWVFEKNPDPASIPAKWKTGSHGPTALSDAIAWRLIGGIAMGLILLAVSGYFWVSCANKNEE